MLIKYEPNLTGFILNCPVRRMHENTPRLFGNFEGRPGMSAAQPSSRAGLARDRHYPGMHPAHLILREPQFVANPESVLAWAGLGPIRLQIIKSKLTQARSQPNKNRGKNNRQLIKQGKK